SGLRLDDIREAVGARAAPEVVRGLTEKRVLERVGRGIYVMHPFRLLATPNAFSSAFLVANLLADQRYYLGGFWALSLHGLSQQVHGSRLDVFVPRALASRTLGNARILFHRLPNNAFEYGLADVPIEGTRARVSDPPRSLLDVLDHSQAVGGIRRGLEL